MEKPHIGQIIYNKLIEDGRTVVWLSKQLNFRRSRIYRIFNESDIDTGVLRRIGKLLKFNFFTLLAEDFDDSE